MGLFGDLDVASASEDVFGVPDATYSAIVKGVKMSKSDNKTDERGNALVGMTVTYKLDDPESQYVGREVGQYQTVPQPPSGEPMTARETQNAGYLKRLLKNLGVPEERMNDVNSEDLVGQEVYITTKKNGDYTNVTRVVLRSEVDGTDVSFT
jgi:hypothetical protein